MKKATTLLLAALLTSCGGETITNANGSDAEIFDLTVSPLSVELEVDQTAQLTADVSTSGDVEDLTVEWISGDTEVATVTRTGELTATATGQGAGNTLIRATATGSNVSGQASGEVSVDVGPEPKIENVSVTPADVNIEVGQTAQLRVDFQTTGNVEGLSVSWTSGNTDVATVSPTGDQTAEVTGQSRGTVSITATVTADNVEGEESASAGVTVE